VRRDARKDANQSEIVSVLRKAGAIVELHHAWPCGYDILVHHSGVTMRVEIKDGGKPPSARKLTDREQQARDANPNSYAVVTSERDALALLVQMAATSRRINADPTD